MAHQIINTKVYEINKQDINTIYIAELILYDSPWINIKSNMTSKYGCNDYRFGDKSWYNSPRLVLSFHIWIIIKTV